MKCLKAQKLINEHIDNLLKDGQVRKLERHLDNCAGCRDLLSDMGSIVHNAKKLDTLSPSDDLWPVIKNQALKNSRKAHTQRGKFFPNFPLRYKGPVFALSTLLALVILIPLFYHEPPQMRDSNNDSVETALSNYQIAEQHYQTAIEALDRVIDVKKAKLSPELMAVFNENLAIIDESIRICKESMKESRETRVTNKLLLLCYRKKVELLNEIKNITMQT